MTRGAVGSFHFWVDSGSGWAPLHLESSLSEEKRTKFKWKVERREVQWRWRRDGTQRSKLQFVFIKVAKPELQWIYLFSFFVCEWCVVAVQKRAPGTWSWAELSRHRWSCYWNHWEQIMIIRQGNLLFLFLAAASYSPLKCGEFSWVWLKNKTKIKANK